MKKCTLEICDGSLESLQWPSQLSEARKTPEDQVLKAMF
jgi:hypothetical protein